MREWWANVYRDAGEAVVGLDWPSRQECQDLVSHDAAFRIHVRLKPEGAPRRYVDDAERYAWERAAQRGETPRYA